MLTLGDEATSNVSVPLLESIVMLFSGPSCIAIVKFSSGVGEEISEEGVISEAFSVDVLKLVVLASSKVELIVSLELCNEESTMFCESSAPR